MNSNYSKMIFNERNNYIHFENKTNFRNSNDIVGKRRQILSDTTFYNISRFLMGNEVRILTSKDKIEGLLRGFDSSTLWLSKVFVYDLAIKDGFPQIKDLLEGKEVLLKDVLLINVIGLNGKTDSVLIDQDISQQKQTTKPILSEDMNLIPYFDQDELLDESKFNLGSQEVDYTPEEMLKKNQELFNLDYTFNDNMEGYTTQIDKNDALLVEKYKIADNLVKEIETDSSLRKFRHSEEDKKMDEETRFSAAVYTVPHSVPSTMSIGKLNPNAPEFRPKQDPVPVKEKVPQQPPTLSPQQHTAVHQKYGVLPQGHRLVGAPRTQWAPHCASPPVQGLQIDPRRRVGPGDAGGYLYYPEGPFGAPIFLQQPPFHTGSPHILPEGCSYPQIVLGPQSECGFLANGGRA